MSDSIPPTAAPQFTITVRGYDRFQVETYVEQLQERLEEARERLCSVETTYAEAVDKLHQRIAELEDEVTTAEREKLTATEPGFRALGEHVGRMLELADIEARAMRERAEREAEETVSRARRDAERLTNEHQEQREQLQRQLRALHDNLATLLGAAPAAPADAAGDGNETGAAAYPAEAPPREPSAAPAPVDGAPVDVFDDATQVVQVIRGGGA